MTISPTPPASPATNQGQSTAQTTQEGIVSNEKIDARNRENIAFGVLIASIVAILLVSATAIFSTTDAKERSLVSQRVMDSTLPLYGTWVGTILAFYFSRNAFEAASSTTDRNATVFQQVRSDLVSAAPPDNKLANISLKSLANGLVFSQDNLNNPLEDVLKDLVTADGQKTSPVVAYVTDNDINEYK